MSQIMTQDMNHDFINYPQKYDSLLMIYLGKKEGHNKAGLISPTHALKLGATACASD
ncbi:MAG: hypothetical protein JWO78_1764 [Micavibrio sp.]|nr:hypothetical protein [Micavibrio sp.]